MLCEAYSTLLLVTPNTSNTVFREMPMVAHLLKIITRISRHLSM